MSEWHLGVMRLFCFDLDPIEPMVCITYIARTALALKIKLYTAWEILGICVRFSQSSLFFMIKIIYLISHFRKCILSNGFQLFLKICFGRHNYHNSSILIHLILHFRYGDKVPKSIPGRVFSFVWMIIGMVCFSILTGTMAGTLTNPVQKLDTTMFGKTVVKLHVFLIIVN